MNASASHSSAPAESEQPAAAAGVRWLLALVLGGLVLALAGGGVLALRWWLKDQAAAAALADDVARLRQRGEPMTVDDLYLAQKLPAGTADTTELWQAAIKLATAAGSAANAKGLPYVGDGDKQQLRPSAADSKHTAAEQYLLAHDEAVAAILAAANAPGQCRFPVAFEQGPTASFRDVSGMRAVVRLLALRMHVQALSNQPAEAIESQRAMLAAADALSHQLTIVEQLVHLAALSQAFGHVELLLNELDLTAEQLVELARRLERVDIQGSFTRSLIGERAVGFEAIQQLGGVLPWTMASRAYIDMLTEVIDASRQPLPAGRKQFQAAIGRFESQHQQAADTWENSQRALTALSLPSLTASFDAYAKMVAYREAILVAIAAERYRRQAGSYPAQLADLTPAPLAEIPRDPFDGQPLRLIRQGDALVIYSIGPNGQDDTANASPGQPGQTDITVRLSAVKGQ